MSYEKNKIKYFLERNSISKIESKSTSSVYYYFKYYSVRYSNHFTQEKLIPRQLQVIRKSKEVWILVPEEIEYKKYNEKTGFYFIRKFLRESKTPKKIYKETKYIKFMKHKHFYVEDRKIKSFLKSIEGTENLKSLIMNLTCID